jgi:hypothetical protein
MEIINSDQLDSIIKTYNIEDAEADNIEDQLLSRFLRYVNVLSTHESEILNAIEYLHKEDIFYNQYYWFCQYKKRYFTLYGRDEGLEQNGFKMLEEYNLRLNGEIDWKFIEQIEEY